ncbi:hypothetical protein HPB50_026118 [Hyalomma asiaticum]|uniref:Uncharacterized protein n=1 Tax=Hyalomma asiaticum TaxID=266040 RepID=A0ACB7TPC1_HYAAI|nr:hypothetical protein HPB50_026118 [Hyalomma asiaticum]
MNAARFADSGGRLAHSVAWRYTSRVLAPRSSASSPTERARLTEEKRARGLGGDLRARAAAGRGGRMTRHSADSLYRRPRKVVEFAPRALGASSYRSPATRQNENAGERAKRR